MAGGYLRRKNLGRKSLGRKGLGKKNLRIERPRRTTHVVGASQHYKRLCRPRPGGSGVLPTTAANGILLPPTERAAGGKGKGKPITESSPRVVAAAFRMKFHQAPVCHPVETIDSGDWSDETRGSYSRNEEAEQGTDMGNLLRVSTMSVFSTVHVVVALYVHEVVFFEELACFKPFQASESSQTRRSHHQVQGFRDLDTCSRGLQPSLLCVDYKFVL